MAKFGAIRRGRHRYVLIWRRVSSLPDLPVHQPKAGWLCLYRQQRRFLVPERRIYELELEFWRRHQPWKHILRKFRSIATGGRNASRFRFEARKSWQPFPGSKVLGK